MKRVLPAIFAALVGTTLILSVGQRANAETSYELAQRYQPYPQSRNYDYRYHHRNRHDDYWRHHWDRHHRPWWDREVGHRRRDRDTHRDWRWRHENWR